MPVASHVIVWWLAIGFTCIVIVLHSSKGNSSHDEETLLRQCLKHSISDEDSALLCLWYEDAGIIHHATQLQEAGLKSFGDFSLVDTEQLSEILGPDFSKFKIAFEKLLKEEEHVNILRTKLAKLLPTKETSQFSTFWKLCKDIVITCLFISAVLAYFEIVHRENGGFEWLEAARLRESILQWISGYRALANNARVTFHWNEPCQVGSTVSFTIEFFQMWSNQPYPVSDGDSINVRIRQGPHKIAPAVQIGGSQPSEINQVKTSFTVRKAGMYHIDVSLGSLPIKGSPFTKHFSPGAPDVAKTLLVRPTSIVVCTVGQDYQLLLEPKDEFGNFCSWGREPKEIEGFSIDCTSIQSLEKVQPFVHWHWVELLRRLILHVTFEEPGIYVAKIKLNGCLIDKGEFNVIALTKKESQLVSSALSTRSPTYEVKLLSLNGEKWTKNKKVFCALSPKQVSLKEYFLGIIPSRLATFRLCPATKFTFDGLSNAHEYPILRIEDGGQQKAEILSKESHLLAAAFAYYLSKNIGGSEKFGDKEAFFNHEIRNYHQKRSHDRLLLRINRQELLQCSMRVTKYFGVSEWCKNFEICFIDEQGLDWGGLRREWIELLCVSMFDRSKSRMFTSFSDDAQALVHPNPKMPSNIKIKHYEFAGRIVGKCLYESSQGSAYRQLVKARFTRSFLAQLIGLRVTYKYFQSDDPQLYLSKIKFIEENDVADMEITFADEEYDENGKLLRTVELIPGGARQLVNNENKFTYLDALAQHRLVNSVKDQVEAFLRGLNELIPDNLLSIFDENELELLMCGTSEYSVLDLKANHVAIGSSPEFAKVLSWFWTAVTNFGPEELSRLLQFVTGSSQLPPGGLAQLTPKLQISASPCFGNLPTAHTCFNQLCLPDYESYEQFERALLVAINEGSEGFGLA